MESFVTQHKLKHIIDLLSNGGSSSASNVDITGNSVGLATGLDINTLQTAIVNALAELPNVEINTEQINLNVQDLEVLITASNTLLTTLGNQQIDGTQISKIRDTAGQELNINPDGSINVLGTITANVPTNLVRESVTFAIEGILDDSRNHVEQVRNQTNHKLNRIKGSADYDSNVTGTTIINGEEYITQITHTGTTNIAFETLIATYTYNLTTGGYLRTQYS